MLLRHGQRDLLVPYWIKCTVDDFCFVFLLFTLSDSYNDKGVASTYCINTFKKTLYKNITKKKIEY